MLYNVYISALFMLSKSSLLSIYMCIYIYKSGATFLKKSHLPENLPGNQIYVTVCEIAFSNFYPDGDLCCFFFH